jgi:phage-related protein
MFTGDNEQGDGVSITPSSANTNLDPELLNLGESVRGINELATETVGTLEEGIVFVDQAMQNVVNQMGQGEVFAKGIKKEIAEAAPLVTLLGGTTKEALAVQQDTLTAFGRNILLSSQQSEE